MLARTGVLKALHRHEVREFKTSETKTHWGTYFHRLLNAANRSDALAALLIGL
jgi:hypothetical protein